MGLSFLKGLVAAVNPCAFVLLPTYLAFFLGTDVGRDVDRRAGVRRALVVSASVSAGFMAVFVAVGLVSEYVTGFIEDNAKYLMVTIAIGFVVVGAAMLTGWTPPVSTPSVSYGRTGRSAVSMGFYGVAYAVSSISCTLPLFVTTMVGNGRRDGFGSGVAHVVAYGAGMALIVTSLTISIALARSGLLGVLERSSRHVHRVAAMLVTGSGLYLLYYFWVVEMNEGSSVVTEAVQTVQERVQLTLNDHWRIVATVLSSIVFAAALYATGRRRRTSVRQ